MITPKKEKKEKIDVLNNIPDKHGENENAPAENLYYATVSYRYRLAKYTTLIMLVVFILGAIGFYREDITYSNFVFLIKDMNTVFESDGILNVQKSVHYNTDKNQKFSIYRKGLAVVGNSDIYLFNSAGKQTFSGQLHYSKPCFSESEKYLLVYDLGGKECSLYNSFAKIHSHQLQYPISAARISNSGIYAILSSDREYTSVVYLYNKNFDLVERHRKNKYITDISLSDNGRELLCVSAETENGEYYTEISLSEIGTGTEKFKLKKNGLFPMIARHTKDGGFFVICDRAVLFFDSENKETGRYDFDELSISRADYADDKVALILSKDTAEKESELVVFDTTGKMLYNVVITGKINDFVCYDKNVYLLLNDEIQKISLDGKETTKTPVAAGAKDMLIVNKGTALLCYASYTRYIEIN